jgi:hypothetical protein
MSAADRWGGGGGEPEKDLSAAPVNPAATSHGAAAVVTGTGQALPTLPWELSLAPWNSPHTCQSIQVMGQAVPAWPGRRRPNSCAR